MIVWTILGGFENKPVPVAPAPGGLKSTPIGGRSKPPASTTWLQKPYYLAPDEVWESGAAFGEALSNESYLQMMLQSTMSDIGAYLNPAHMTGLQTKTAAAIVANYQATATQRQGALKGLAGDAMALGLKYGNMQVSLMHQIQSAPGSPVSLWGAWITA